MNYRTARVSEWRKLPVVPRRFCASVVLFAPLAQYSAASCGESDAHKVDRTTYRRCCASAALGHKPMPERIAGATVSDSIVPRVASSAPLAHRPQRPPACSETCHPLLPPWPAASGGACVPQGRPTRCDRGWNRRSAAIAASSFVSAGRESTGQVLVDQQIASLPHEFHKARQLKFRIEPGWRALASRPAIS